MNAQYKIQGKDQWGVTSFHMRFSSLKLAEQAFDAITHDEINQNQNWFLFHNNIDEPLNWHCPLRGVR